MGRDENIFIMIDKKSVININQKKEKTAKIYCNKTKDGGRMSGMRVCFVAKLVLSPIK